MTFNIPSSRRLLQSLTIAAIVLAALALQVGLVTPTPTGPGNPKDTQQHANQPSALSRPEGKT